MRIDTFTPPASRTPAEAAARESGRPAVVGDVLEAEVLTVAERQFTFRLPDGTVLSARSETVLQASPGDTLWLTVSGQSDGVLLVEAAGGRSDARSLLHQWKAGQTPQNVRLVSAMLNAGLPPAERLFRWLASALVSVPDITPEQAVFLRAHNIPLDKQSVAFLNRMSRQDLMLGRQLLGLIELLCPAAEPAGRADTAGIVSMPGRAAATGPEATGADSAGASYGAPVSPEGSAPSGRAPGDAINPAAISPHTAASLETEILSIFGRAAADSAGGIGLPGVMDVDVLRAMIREMSDSRIPADLIEQPADLTDPARPAAADESAPAPGARAGTPEAAATPMPGEAPAAGRIPAALARIAGTFGTAGTAGAFGMFGISGTFGGIGAPGMAGTTGTTEAAGTPGIAESAKTAGAPGMAGATETPGAPGMAGATETAETAETTGAIRALGTAGMAGTAEAFEAAEATGTAARADGLPGEAPASKILSLSGTEPDSARAPGEQPRAPDGAHTPSLRETLTGLFRDIRPEQAGELPRAMDADQLTRRLLDALRAAGEAASAHPPAERMRAEAVLRDIAAGVRFTQQLGNFAAVVQWPVMLNGREATAELYVFGGDSGARGRIDPKNATLFLSLGTANMGRVEVLVKVIGQQVECDFRLPSKEQANFVRSAAPKLGALLEGAGYRLTRSSFIQSLEPAAGPLAVAEARAFFDRRYRFDRQI